MALFHSPNVTTNGLVLCLDAANVKSYDTTHNLMFYSGVQGASGATKPTGWLIDQGFGTAVDTSNNTSLTIDGVGYWQFDIVGTTSTNNFLLLSQNQFIGVVPGTTYTVTYNYSLPVAFATVSSLSSQIIWYNASNGVISSSEQHPGNFTTWNKSTNLAKSSYSAVAPAGTVTARVRIFYYNPHPTVTTINYTGFRVGGVQLNIGSSATSYVATTATQVLPTTAWKDLSGNGNNATLVVAPTYSTQGFFTFNGSSTYASIPSSASLTTTTPTIIIACTVASSGTPMAKGQYGSYWNYGITQPAATSFKLRNNGGDTVSATYGTISGMNIFAGVWDGTNMNFYLNGNFIGQSTTNYSPVASDTGFLTIGCALNPGAVPTEFFNGNIAMIQVYNRALSTNEIKQNFNALRGRFGL